MSLKIILLAAGQGKRMNSSLPKVLHPLGGKSLLQHVLDTSLKLNPESIYVIYGHQGEQVKKNFEQFPKTQWIYQEKQLGTGHAVRQALPYLSDEDKVFVLSADVPLISFHALQRLRDDTPSDSVGLMVAEFPNPYGLGRIIRNNEGYITQIIEEKDASPTEKQLKEIYSGIMMISAKYLKKWLPELNANNAQREFYLTEIIRMAVAANVSVVGIKAYRYQEVCGVNDHIQLAMLERYYQMCQAEEIMLKGVAMVDPSRFDLRGSLEVAQDVLIDVNVVIEGDVSIGKHSVIGPNCVLRNTKIGEHVQIKENCVIEESTIEDHSVVGPFARLRPGVHLSVRTKVGNFVEMKKSFLGPGSKVPHLSYIGDTKTGSNVNVGAGTITCNYDGASKHLTVIEDDAFIGSDTQLVAPVTIGKNATIGAGSTIRKDAPPGMLTLTYSEQKTVSDWVSPRDRKLKE